MSEQLLLDERVLKGIELGESHFREFKSALQRDPDGNTKPRELKEVCRDIAEALVAFSNADGGELFVGVEDDGAITGIPHSEQKVELMVAAPKTHVHQETPLPPPMIKRIVWGEKTVLYFRIEKGIDGVNQTTDGRCLKRFDRGNRPVSAEGIQLDRQEEKSREFDREHLQSSSMQDLNLELIDSVSRQVAPGFSPEKLIQFLGLGEYGPSGLRLRRAALLLFAKDIVKWHPRCEVRILRVVGTEIGAGRDYNVMEDETIRGNVIEILENAWDQLRPFLARTKFQANAIFKEAIIYPEDACREAMINAVAHRDYSIEGEPIEITVFDDRMEIRNPGRLLSSVSVEQLLELERSHESRNVFTARVLRELGYMREMGEGMKRIFASMRRSDLVDPKLQNERKHFIVTLYHRSIFSPKDIQWLDGFCDFDLTKDEQRVMLLGRDGRLLSTSEIMETVGYVDTEEFRALFEDLRRKGLIYTVPTTQSQKRNRGGNRKVPKFKVLSPQESRQFLDQLKNAAAHLGEVEGVGREEELRIKGYLSPTSPYMKNPIWSLVSLGYLDSSRRTLPKFTALLKVSKHRTIGVADLNEIRLRGTVKLIKENGFGFAIAETGEEFYLHAYEFDDPDEFREIDLEMEVTFEAGQRAIPGKKRAAKRIKIVRDTK